MFCCLEVFEFGQKEKPEPVQYSSVGLQRRKEQPCLFTFTCGPSVAACTACDPMSRCEVTQRHQGPVTSDPLPLMSLTHITRGECPARHRGALTCRTRLNNTIISGIGYGHMARLTINRRVSPRHWIITGLFVPDPDLTSYRTLIFRKICPDHSPWPRCSGGGMRKHY